MNWGRQTDRIHTWWESIPGERYWLDVTERDGKDDMLAAPRNPVRGFATWTQSLVTHVRSGDVVFHYDATERGITGWSVAHGRVAKHQLLWPLCEAHDEDGPAEQWLPSWGIRLRQSTRLAAPVSLREIARLQSSIFPTLRALEERVGDPLYYPFAMGDDETTHPLAGFVFKLPADFVQSCPELASVAAAAIEVPARSFEAPAKAARPWVLPRPGLNDEAVGS